MSNVKKVIHSKLLLRELCLFSMDKNIFNELGYPLFSDKNHTWYLYVYNERVVGFCSMVKKNGYTSFNHDYVLKEYRNRGFYSEMFKCRLNDCSGKLKAVCTHKSINVFLKNGFKEIKRTKNYIFVELNK